MNTQYIVIGLIGFFFVAFGAYQLKTKTLIRARGRQIVYERDSRLLYVFAPLEMCVGLYALFLVGSDVVHAGAVVGRCNEREQSLECREFSTGGWDTAAMQRACSVAVAARTPCVKDNLLGRCELHDGAGASTIYYYSGIAYIKDQNDPRYPLFNPTAEQQKEACAHRGGKWSS